MEFPGVLKKKHVEIPFQGLIKKEVEILGVFKKKTNAEFPWVLVFDFGISKGCHTNLQNFQG